MDHQSAESRMTNRVLAIKIRPKATLWRTIHSCNVLGNKLKSCYCSSMLPKLRRLSKDRDYKKIFKESKPLKSGHLILRSKKAPATKFGFIVSNKIDKRATRRNYIRRRLRAIAAGLIPNILTESEVVVIVKEPYGTGRAYDEMKKDLTEGLEKLGLISSKN